MSPHDNADTESVNRSHQKELTDREGPQEEVREVTLATMEWVTRYSGESRHTTCGSISPKRILGELLHPAGCTGSTAVFGKQRPRNLPGLAHGLPLRPPLVRHCALRL
jgi:hypothetical protein